MSSWCSVPSAWAACRAYGDPSNAWSANPLEQVVIGCDDGRRVHPAAEKCAQRHVAAKVQPDRFVDRLAEPAGELVLSGLEVRFELHVPIALHGKRTARLEHRALSGVELADTIENAL